MCTLYHKGACCVAIAKLPAPPRFCSMFNPCSTYWNPKATGKDIIRVSRYVIGAW